MGKKQIKIKKKKIDLFIVLVHIFFVLFCVCFIVPFMVVIAASFTSEDWLIYGSGFGLLPKEFTTEAYRSAFANGERVIRAYGVTIAQSVIGTVSSVLVAALCAYPLSRSNFRFKKPITIFLIITMLYGAGMIPTYILYSRVYKIANTFWIYILPGITGGAMSTFVYKTFFKSIPESLFESAKIDGAKELTIFFKIAMPLSTPVLATQAFIGLVGRWNNYSTSMIYIRDESLYTLQYLLQRIMAEAQFLQSLSEKFNIKIKKSCLPGEA